MDFTFQAPFAIIGITITPDFVSSIHIPAPAHSTPPDLPLARQVAAELAAYFADARHPFTLPLCLRGTPFQQRVWQALADIPPGRVMTYGELAHSLHSGARAVGNACRANPVPIVIPCHRVVARKGLGGYMGDKQALAYKRWLLAHEGAL